MRSTNAYIASFGTTGLLVASSLMILAIASALFAFDGWPGAGMDDGVKGLIVEQRLVTPEAAAAGHTATSERAGAAALSGDRSASRGEQQRRRRGADQPAARVSPPAPGGGGGTGDGDGERQSGPPAPATPQLPTANTPSVPVPNVGAGGGDLGGAIEHTLGGVPEVQVGVPAVELLGGGLTESLPQAGQGMP